MPLLLGEGYGQTCALNGLGHALAGQDKRDDEEQARARTALARLGEGGR